ncbi:Hypothetical predicted protein [Pelobates cultripes]|uniref:Uncharacterized protein n=1 Tax=Pelobates cultripes TaxID=61616 RepID=A0AAD1RM39_PELCU|nr:Hypothetical predicted protein [Pelobates cultripes]
MLSDRGMAHRLAVKLVATWLRPVTRRRHYRYPLQERQPDPANIDEPTGGKRHHAAGATTLVPTLTRTRLPNQPPT